MTSTPLSPDPEFNAETYYGETRPGAGLLFQERVSAFTKKQAAQIFQGLYQALRRAEKLKDQNALAWTNLKIAMMLRGQRQHNSAVQVLSRVLSIFESRDDQFGLGVVYDELSCVNRELSRNALALQYSNQAATIFQQLGRSMELGWSYDNMAITYLNMARNDESLVYAKKARSIFEQHDMKSCLAWNACNLGNLYFEMGSYEQAEAYYQEALETFTALGVQQGQAWSLLWLGMLNRARSAFDQAIPYMERSQREFERLNFNDRAGWCLLNIAAIKLVQGKSDEALQLNKKAISLFRPLNHFDGLAWGTFQMAQIFHEQGLLMKAWQWVRKSIDMYDHIANQKGTGWAHNELGRIYDTMQDPVHARECFLKAESIAQQLNALPLQAEASKNLANHHMAQASLRKAATCLAAATAICEKLKENELTAMTLIARARYSIITNDGPEANRCMEKAAVLIEHGGLLQLRPQWALCQAEAHCLDGKCEMALEILVQARKTCDALKMKVLGLEVSFALLQLTKTGKLLFSSKEMKALQNKSRSVGLRKMKAKQLALLAIKSLQDSGELNLELCNQSLEILGKTDLLLLRWQFLELFSGRCRESNPAQAKLFDEDRRSLENGFTSDVPRVISRLPLLKTLPISIII